MRLQGDLVSSASLEIQQKIQQWKRKLSNQSRSNTLLNFRESSGKNTRLDIDSSILFNSFLNDFSSPIELNFMGLNPSERRDRIKRIQYLRRTSDQIKREKGINCLFATIGKLTWKLRDSPSNITVSPIILVPIELQKIKAKDEYTITSIDEDAIINTILLQRLDGDYNIQIPDLISSKISDWDTFRNQFNTSISGYPEWRIEAVNYISLVEQRKGTMLQDLEQYKDLIVNHPILCGLANNTESYKIHNKNEIDYRKLDDQDPISNFQILDADSSQQVIIKAAKNGLSFITQGPPGTGKSQTIANIIAELISLEKKVLLVAEKPSALEVVYQRFKSCKLDSLCLALHHETTSSKRGFSQSLMSAIKIIENTSEQYIKSYFFEQLKSNRIILNSHKKNLHTRWPAIERSAFDIYNELILLERKGIADLEMNISNIEEWSTDRIFEAKRNLEDLGVFSKLFREEEKTVWKRSNLTVIDSKVKAEINHGLYVFQQGIERLKKASKDFQELLEINALDDRLNRISTCHFIIDVIMSRPFKLPQGWENVDLKVLIQEFSDLKEAYACLLEQHKKIEHQYDLKILESDISESLNKLQSSYKDFDRILQQGYWKICRRIFGFRKSRSNFKFFCTLFFGYKSIVNNLESVVGYKKLEKYIFKTNSSRFSSFFGENDIDFLGIEKSIIWIERLQDLSLNRKRVFDIFSSMRLLEKMTRQRDDLMISENMIRDGFGFLNFLFPKQELKTIINYSDADNTSLSNTLEFLNIAKRELVLFQKWTRCQKYIRKLEQLGIKTFLDDLKRSSIEPELWVDTFMKAILLRWLDHIYDLLPELRDFSSSIHEKRIEEFSAQDKEQYILARERIQVLHKERWKEWSSKLDNNSQLASLRYEANKHKKHKSIRHLIEEISELIVTLKPCWLLNPVAVSEYIDPEVLKFDAVIFDEASQIRTEEAVSSILRAKQVIVVGDDKQLPPTNNFQRYFDDEDKENDEDYESLLTECGKFMRFFSLKWHYRSQDESLIAFSNKEFYDFDLVTFPNPVRSKDRGVHFCHVTDGVYEPGKRRNLSEAKKIVDLCLYHAQSSEQSLGIIAFNEKQADAIQEEIDSSSEEHRILEDLQENPKRFFITNLESVQGEERDVIIISFCFARDATGKFKHYFGALNKPGGERRLNVAITRARKKLILVSSIRSYDLKPSGKSELQIQKLQDYFAYVERGGHFEKGANNSSSEVVTDSELIENICSVLVNEGYAVKRSIGQSRFPIDIAVINKRNKEEFLLGIECDGKTYKEYKTARDRDRLRRQVLKDNLSWNIYRIWSKDWFLNREQETTRLLSYLRYLEDNHSKMNA